MHYSRIHTARSLTVSPSMHCAGGVWSQRGVPGPGRGVPGPGQVVSRHALRQTPLPWTEFLTHAAENITLPQTSFAGGNNNDFYAGEISCIKLRSTKKQRKLWLSISLQSQAIVLVLIVLLNNKSSLLVSLTLLLRHQPEIRKSNQNLVMIFLYNMGKIGFKIR